MLSRNSISSVGVSDFRPSCSFSGS